jgi:UDP-2,3-diacylglucosamine hydrolase
VAEGPILFIAGDVHLQGGPSAFARWLRQLLLRPKARLVLLGDLFEYWLETDDAVKRYAEVLSALQVLAEAGWQLDLVLGNRELAAGRRLAIASRCRLHWPKLDLKLGDKRIRIVHGDRLCHDPGYHFFSAWIRSFWHRAWQSCHPAFVQDAVARAMRSQSKSRQLAKMSDAAKRVFIDRRRVQAAGRGVDTLIAGHIHQSWRRRIGGVDMILVGDWPDEKGHWVEGLADGTLIQRAQGIPA